jgi:hypothetical protein
MKASGYDPVFTLLQHTVINLQCSSAVFRFYVKFALALNSHMYVNEVPQPRLKAVYDPNNEFTINPF